jgi:precorrin-3B synthase
MYAPAPTDSPIGFVPFPGRTRGAVVAGVPRGRINAATLSALADLSERYADATVRMTPWRALAFVPISADNAGALEAALSALGLITDPSDPRRALRGPDIAPAAGASAIPETLSR